MAVSFGFAGCFGFFGLFAFAFRFGFFASDSSSRRESPKSRLSR
jgi:hypothetical protein